MSTSKDSLLSKGIAVGSGIIGTLILAKGYTPIAILVYGGGLYLSCVNDMKVYRARVEDGSR